MHLVKGLKSHKTTRFNSTVSINHTPKGGSKNVAVLGAVIVAVAVAVAVAVENRKQQNRDREKHRA